LPFNNDLIMLTLSGAALRIQIVARTRDQRRDADLDKCRDRAVASTGEALQHAIGSIRPKLPVGRFLQISGLEFDWFTNAGTSPNEPTLHRHDRHPNQGSSPVRSDGPVFDGRSRSVHSVRLRAADGTLRQIDDNSTITCVVPSYIAAGGDGFSVFAAAPTRVSLGSSTQAAVGGYLVAVGPNISSALASPVEHRIVHIIQPRARPSVVRLGMLEMQFSQHSSALSRGAPSRMAAFKLALDQINAAPTLLPCTPTDRTVPAHPRHSVRSARTDGAALCVAQVYAPRVCDARLQVRRDAVDARRD
jgi:hypothetical protein